MHQFEMVLTVVKEMSQKYNIPIRVFEGLNTENLSDMNKNIHEVLEYYGQGNTDVDSIISILKKCKNREIIEIMCHPAYADQELLQKTSYGMERTKELVTLTSEELKKYIKDNNIELINYRNIK